MLLINMISHAVYMTFCTASVEFFAFAYSLTRYAAVAMS